MLERCPDLWRVVGDLNEMAFFKLVSTLRDQPGFVECITQGRKEMRRQLGYDAAPLLEKLLIDAVLLGWLRYNQVEHRYTTIMSQP